MHNRHTNNYHHVTYFSQETMSKISKWENFGFLKKQFKDLYEKVVAWRARPSATSLHVGDANSSNESKAEKCWTSCNNLHCSLLHRCSMGLSCHLIPPQMSAETNGTSLSL